MTCRAVLLLVLSVSMAACSTQRDQAADPVREAVVTPPTLDKSGTLYFYGLLQRPDFSLAFAAMPGTGELPAWTRHDERSTPALKVEVGGREQWLAVACKPHDCPTERILVLYDAQAHAMTGLFARRKLDAMDLGRDDPTNDELTWLGLPDDETKQFLHERMYSAK
ncbi:Ivy family c-type lysozyme inhibitor [Dyella jiangningensis]|uniref:Ivy family c-type lysozyme inhibitor n=1 Tax=Dyella jiangningensis TaxID=1379159 RepID=UPI0009E081AE|nr:Ivy family c-type lysozyme inhibitor [Dyella jiangningensis]MDG2537579.1 Ivy family c-type lysozyme inhibitor [Dyella jiangningensis]